MVFASTLTLACGSATLLLHHIMRPLMKPSNGSFFSPPLSFSPPFSTSTHPMMPVAAFHHFTRSPL